MHDQINNTSYSSSNTTLLEYYYVTLTSYYIIVVSIKNITYIMNTIHVAAPRLNL